jgi:predicted TPR repeat methyltransferase
MSCASTMANARLRPDADSLCRAQSCIEEGRPADAVAILTPLIESGGGGLLARLLHARALQGHGQAALAMESARETALLHPDSAAAALGLAETLLSAGELPHAIAEFQRALRLDPDLDAARYGLGCAWLAAGEPENALRAFGVLPADRAPPDLPARIAEAQRMRTAPRSDARYVRHLFDQFSSDYDARMVGELGYAAPHILRELAILVMPGLRDRTIDILDLGCGTGLAGAVFRQFAKRLDGIDLSPCMLDRARGRRIYDRLSAGDIEAIPVGGSPYDLAVAADTFVYLGDLAPVFAAAHRVLKSGGFFLFTVEKNEGGGFVLGPKRRWRHSENYLKTAAHAGGFDIAGVIACSPRTEAGVAVDGLAVALQKPL